jgi:predicted PurR-regulated permease PerM
VTLIVAYFSYKIIEPFLVTIILTLVLAFLFYPMYRKLTQYIKRDWLASLLMVIFVLLLIIIPATILATKLVTDSASAYRSFIDLGLNPTEVAVLERLPESSVENTQIFIDQMLGHVKDYIVSAAPDVVGGIANFILHLFVSMFLLYFAFVHGKEWYKWIRNAMPLNPKLKELLFKDLERSTNAIVYGQFLTAVIQGSLGGLMFFIFGVPNAIFWGFIMIIFAFVPFLGTPMIFVPAALLELAQGDYLAGFGVLIVGGIIVMNIDNLLRPFLIGSFGKIHPVIVLVGVLGGLQVFGFAGMILGPLILAIMITLIKDFSSHHADELLEPLPKPKSHKKSS